MMTLDEFIIELTAIRNRFERNGQRNGDHRVTIRYSGSVGGSTVDIAGVGIGFDWTKGQIVLTPETQLSIFQTEQQIADDVKKLEAWKADKTLPLPTMTTNKN